MVGTATDGISLVMMHHDYIMSELLSEFLLSSSQHKID
jgi:hypothetical protein